MRSPRAALPAAMKDNSAVRGLDASARTRLSAGATGKRSPVHHSPVPKRPLKLRPSGACAKTKSPAPVGWVHEPTSSRPRTSPRIVPSNAG